MSASVARVVERWASSFERKLEALPFIRSEDWPGGVVVTFLRSPFPRFSGRYPFVRGSDIQAAVIEQVQLADVRGSQTEVTDVGLRKYQNGFGQDLPILIALANGTFAIQDGHHRLVALQLRGKTSTQARVVRFG
jgi:hypothetical protein